MRLPVYLISMLLGLSVQSAWAFGLGQISVASRLGQPFHAAIRLQKSELEELDASCFRLGRGQAGNDLPVLPRAEIAYETINGGHFLVIRTRSPVSEPAFRVIVETGCQLGVKREYVVLLDLPENPVTLDSRMAPAPARTESQPRPEMRPEEKQAQAYVVLESDTLEGILQRLAGDSPRSQRRLALEILGLNPHIKDEGSGLVVLRPGMVLRLPDRGPGHAPRSSGTPIKSKAPAASTGVRHARRVAAPGKTTEGKVRLKVSMEILDVTLIDHTGKEERAALRAAWQQIKDGEAALTSQLEKERQSLDALQRRIESLTRELEGLRVGQPTTPIAAKTAEPVAAPGAKPADSIDGGKAYWGYVLLFLASCALLAFAVRMRAKRPSPEAVPAIAPPEEEMTQTAPEPPRPAPVATKVLPAAEVPPKPGDVIEVSEVESITDKARFYMEIGRPAHAIDLFQQQANQESKVKAKSWLNLVDLCKTLGLQEEYTLTIKGLHQNYNVALPAAQQKLSGELLKTSLEDFSRITEKIGQLWGTTECYEYIVHLLHDNREGQRCGFSLEVFTDLVFLADVLEHLLDLPQSDIQDMLPDMPPDSWEVEEPAIGPGPEDIWENLQGAPDQPIQNWNHEEPERPLPSLDAQEDKSTPQTNRDKGAAAQENGSDQTSGWDNVRHFPGERRGRK
jgi:hypothetical protein